VDRLLKIESPTDEEDPSLWWALSFESTSGPLQVHIEMLSLFSPKETPGLF